MRTLCVVLSIIVMCPVGSASAVHSDARHSRYLIYLHGRIVQEQQNARPRHAQYGYYELDGILNSFRQRGFLVTGEIRSRDTSVSDAANRVVAHVQRILGTGVPADHITVVGASMGAGIALLASARLQNPGVRFCVLGMCLSENVRYLIDNEGKAPCGEVLSIRESSDDATKGCPPWSARPNNPPRFEAREIVLNTGLSHGFLYTPLADWVGPVADWAQRR